MRVGLADPSAYAEWKRRRRDVARRFHPDLGGDPETYLRQMRAVDEEFGVGTRAYGSADQSSTRRRGSRARHRARRRLKATARRVRAKLPRRLPGSRRYFDI